MEMDIGGQNGVMLWGSVKFDIRDGINIFWKRKRLWKVSVVVGRME